MVDVSSACEVENILVTHNDPKYAMTEHRYKLTLIDRTKLTKIPGSKIPVNHFDYMAFNDILESDKEEKNMRLLHGALDSDFNERKEFSE
jgi:hypothetical protein